MKQLILTKFGDPEDTVRLVDTPEPVAGPGKVLVRLEAAAINPSDLLLLKGKYLVHPELPAGVGAEGVGIVEAVGPEVDSNLVGKRVIVLPTYTYGTWSEKVVAAAHDVIEVPDADPQQLAMLSINPPTAHLLLDRFVNLQVGDWVGQTAANSAVGRYVTTLARRRGLKTLNIVRREDAVEDVRAAGGDVVVVSGPNLADDIKQALGGDRLSLVIDPLGGSAASDLIGALEFGGTAVAYASLTGTPMSVSSADLFGREVRLTGFWLGNWYASEPRHEIVDTLDYLARLIAEGVLHAPVDATYHLDDYLKAFTHARSAKRGGKILFTFE